VADIQSALALRISHGQSGVPNRAPNGLEHLIALPDTAIGKANFETARLLTPSLSQLPYLQSSLICHSNISRYASQCFIRPKLTFIKMF